MRAMYALMQANTQEVSILERVFDQETRVALSEDLEFLPDWTSMEQLEGRKGEFQTVEVLFSTWGMAQLSAQQIGEYFPSLKAVFYAAGSVQYFARPFLERGVRVFSAADANAIPVIEYTVAQIVLANKGYFQAARLYSGGEHQAAREHFSHFAGNYGGKVGILGAGKIGGGVVEMLSNYRLNVCIYDPFLPPERAASWGAELLPLERVFEECFVVSNHLANNADTQGILTYDHFRRMHPYGVFLNTGRGAQVVEADLVRALAEQPGRTAVLDVTHPEPVEPGHPFYAMDNVLLTPHIAGSSGDEVARMGAFMQDAYQNFRQGSACPYEVTLKMLETMA